MILTGNQQLSRQLTCCPAVACWQRPQLFNRVNDAQRSQQLAVKSRCMSCLIRPLASAVQQTSVAGCWSLPSLPQHQSNRLWSTLIMHCQNNPPGAAEENIAILLMPCSASVCDVAACHALPGPRHCRWPSRFRTAHAVMPQHGDVWACSLHRHGLPCSDP